MRLFVETNNTVMNSQNKRDRRERASRRQAVDMALLRNSYGKYSGDSLEYDLEEVKLASSGRGSNKKRCRQFQTVHMSDHVVLFAYKLKEADMARVAQESYKLKFEHGKCDKDLKESSKDKKEHRKER